MNTPNRKRPEQQSNDDGIQRCRLCGLSLWAHMTGVTSSSLTSLSFVVIKRLVGGLDCLADLFPLTCDGPFRHSDELELLEGLDVSFNDTVYVKTFEGENFRGWTAKWSFAGKHSRLRT